MKRLLRIIVSLYFLLLVQKNHAQDYDIHDPQGPYIEEFFKENDLIFDVGAHQGVKTEEYLKAGTHVVCIEPQPFCLVTLHKKFKCDPRITILPFALGESSGHATLHICESAPTISTLSTEWCESSRFSQHNYQWNYSIKVPMITLDECIKQYGLPQFCKIDVENFELSVLRGLSQQIPCLSFEFASETLHNTCQCLDHLKNLGYNEFNVGVGEHNRLLLPSFVSAEELVNILLTCNNTPEALNMWGLWGDIYAKMSTPNAQ